MEGRLLTALQWPSLSKMLTVNNLNFVEDLSPFQPRCGAPPEACLNQNIGMQIPVLVSDLDLECQLWLKIRLAPMTPYFGTVSLAFVGAPTIKVQLLPYNRVRLMRVPVVQVCLPVLSSLAAAQHGCCGFTCKPACSA